jgi:hypothetical protein
MFKPKLTTTRRQGEMRPGSEMQGDNVFFITGRSLMTKKKQVTNKMYTGNPDKRIIEKLMRNKSLTKEELNAYLKTLPDVSDRYDEVTVELGDQQS